MKFLIFFRKVAFVALFWFLLPAALPGCSFFQEEQPDPRQLEQRTATLIAVGWQWLHAENMSFKGGGRRGEFYAADFDYEIVIDVDGVTLSEFEKERFATFLSVCAGMDVKPQARCRIFETVNFVKTETYGWMPEIAVRLMPGYLAEIAADRGDGK